MGEAVAPPVRLNDADGAADLDDNRETFAGTSVDARTGSLKLNTKVDAFMSTANPSSVGAMVSKP